MAYTGRRIIWTDEREITADNIISVLQDAWASFSANRDECDYLLSYDAGEQPLQREKHYRPDINIVCIDNVANEVSNFWRGYMFGNEISLVQRGKIDNGKKNRSEHEAVALLNECYTTESGKSKTAELGRFVEITGIGYTYIDINTNYIPGDSYFKYTVIDPRYGFVVRSRAYTDHRVVLGVAFREDSKRNRYFTCFTDSERYEISGGKVVNEGRRRRDVEYKYFHGNRSGEFNPLGVIPIVEWVRDFDRMGCFERQLADMDTLNIEESDFANMVDQNVQALWHANDVEFVKDENGNTITPKSNDWVFTQTTRDGKTPSITPLAVPTEYSGIMQNITTKRATILQKCNVPQRNDNSGGSTGVAMSDATGWSQADVEATKQQGIMEGCKMQEVRVALEAIRNCPNTPSDSPLLTMRYSDVKPNVKRQKNYEMVTKANTFAVLIANQINGLHAINAINFFDDPQQVWEDSKENIEKYQKSLIANRTAQETNPQRAGSDESDQISNSPNIDGMDREDPEGKKDEEEE